MMMRKQLTQHQSLLWFGIRLYALGLTAFIAAFGAFRWRLPGYRERYGRGRDSDNELIGPGPDDASAEDPSWRPSYRPDVPVAPSSRLSAWWPGVWLILALLLGFVLIALLV